ncbi:D-alanyl-D-alanine carboxypeptidase family protein [Oceanirhabdus sp. W0125-5]|uniref:D-alanyl-D-alanine carboxypeptidase family protein n=1 Tax=Oceanirhabdus sp. W0125-5 TaxID=2999116 RepID=UPI0022F2EB4F|nr:D-alanyl-D-alanine carboxypeptidase family protein [Oceanirhabdus sp. W0125-5]WBW95300.1 D-alanyl-D-alanine carboxypeptidase [Oceanirhabdus sp. W0125-5]
MLQKKRVTGFLLFFMLITTNAQAMDTITNNRKLRVNAVSFIAMDAESGMILCEKNSKKILAMASTTKILTCLIAIELCKLDEIVTVSSKAATTYGSKVHLKSGEKIKVEELLYGLMLKSGNDAAVALAEHIGGNVENFSKIMNDYAFKLGLLSSNFRSPHGLDKENHYSTSYDLAKATSIALKNETFRKIVGCKSIAASEKDFNRSYVNINKILHRLPNATGVKTGYTGNAGKCLVSSFRYMDRDIVIVTLNCPNRWNETIKIAEYVKANYEVKKLYSKGDILGEVKADNSCDKSKLICGNDIIIPVKKGISPDINIKIPEKGLKAPLHKGINVGSIEISYDNNKLYEQPLVLQNNISKHSKLRIFIKNKFTKNEK